MKRVHILYGLVAACVFLTICSIVLLVLYLQQKQAVMSPTQQSLPPLPPLQISVKSDDNLPVYPKRDPVYPLRGVPSKPQQVGIVISEGGNEPQILPLFGAPVPTNRDRWNYYASTDGNHMLRIPIAVDGKDCTDKTIGCRELYDQDTIDIPAYKKSFTASLYKPEAVNPFAST